MTFKKGDILVLIREPQYKLLITKAVKGVYGYKWLTVYNDSGETTNDLRDYRLITKLEKALL